MVYIPTLPKLIVMSVRPWATLPNAPNRIGPGRVSGSSGARLQPADTNAVLFKGFLDLLHFENYFLSFGGNSKILGEVTPSTWTRNDS